MADQKKDEGGGNKSSKFVEFVGTPPYGRQFHSSHTIDKADAKRVGATVEKTLIWDTDNDFRIPASEIDKSMLKVLEKDPSFKVVED